MDNKRIPIDGTHKKEVTSDASVFYENYWIKGGELSQESVKRAHQILNAVFPSEKPSDQTIIELGVGGEGGLLLFLKDTNKVHGFDVSSTAVSICTDLGIPSTILNADKESLPYEDATIDVVFACEVFEHFSNPQTVLEEIRRVLKPSGLLALTIPHPFIHHWPRLFYPSLFQSIPFRDFLMVNRFKIRVEGGIGDNMYASIAKPNDHMWSLLWVAERLSETDSENLDQIGRYFFDKRTSNGIRTHAIEACDFFRFALNANPNNMDAAFALALALVYRAINGETEEFNKILTQINEHIQDETSPHHALAKNYMMAIDAELARFGLNRS